MKLKAFLTAATLLVGSVVFADEPLVGNAENGRVIYAGCSGCHGADAMGNEALNAPRLAGQKSWYLVTQLNNFRSGLRGTISGDNGGAMMRPMAISLLPDDQAIADIAAYLEAL